MKRDKLVSTIRKVAITGLKLQHITHHGVVKNHIVSLKVAIIKFEMILKAVANNKSRLSWESEIGIVDEITATERHSKPTGGGCCIEVVKKHW